MRKFISQIYKININHYDSVAFLDRDGTLIKHVDYLRDKDQVTILPGVINALRNMESKGFLRIVITNQPVVARGLATEKDVKDVNNYLVNKLSEQNAFVHAVYSCPHHPDGNIRFYREKCTCRKPGLKMFQHAIRDFQIDVLGKRCFMFGDRTEDIKAGEKLGLETVLLKTGCSGRDKKYKINQNHTFANLEQAVNILLKG